MTIRTPEKASLIVGIDVVTMANGREALDHLREHAVRPCLVVLDLAMPVMDGCGFRRAQLADYRLKDLSVVVMSGGGSAAKAEARMLGLTTFLRRPVDIGHVLQLLKDHCAGARPLGLSANGNGRDHNRVVRGRVRRRRSVRGAT
jgi:CheY-like chemotaxis protein